MTNNKNSIIGNSNTNSSQFKIFAPQVSNSKQLMPKEMSPARSAINQYAFQTPDKSFTTQNQSYGVMPSQPPKINTDLSKQDIEKITGKKISDKNFNQFMNVQKQMTAPAAISSAPTTTTPKAPTVSSTPTGAVAASPVSSSAPSTATTLKSKELDLQKLQSEIKKATHKNISLDTLKKFAPAFETVQKSIQFVAKLNEKRDYDDQHYTVPTTQSLFSLTANQIANMPIWRN